MEDWRLAKRTRSILRCPPTTAYLTTKTPPPSHKQQSIPAIHITANLRYPIMATTEDHTRAHQNNTFRKIELQSPADLAHLQTASQRAARQKINVAFPPAAQEGGEDELRKRVETLVKGYVDEVFRGVKANILVNGVEVTDSGDGKGGAREVTEGEMLSGFSWCEILINWRRG
jgi:hypothetical protein